MTTSINRRPSPRAATAWLAVGALALAACGGDDDSAEPDASEPAASETSVASPETAAPETPSAATASDTVAPPGTGTAGGDEWDSIVAAAKEEGAVTVAAGGAPDSLALQEAAFEATYPEIDLTYQRGTGSEIAQRLDAELAAGGTDIDVASHSNVQWYVSHQTEDPEIFAAPLGPNVVAAAEVGAIRYPPNVVTVGGTGYGYGWSIAALGEADPGIDGILANDDLRGRIGLYDYQANPALLAYTMVAEEKFGEEYLTRLAELDPRWYPSTVPMAQAVAAGEIDVAFPMYGDALVGVEGVALAFPDLPITLFSNQAIINGSPHPNAAQVYLDWSMSVDGQNVVQGGNVAIIPGVDEAAFTGDEVTGYDALSYTADESDAAMLRYNELFGR